MLQTVKMNTVIPLSYQKNDYEKTMEPILNISKEQAETYRESGKIDSPEWFHYCFRKKPIEANDQMAESPLIKDENYRISRIELNSVSRALIGIHIRENTCYTLLKQNIGFEIRKIRLLFTKSRIAFLHMEFVAQTLSNDETREFINAFSQIHSKQPQMEYSRKINKDTEEVVRVSLKNVIKNILNLQSYIPLKFWEDRITPYFQITMIGVCDNEEKLKFFNSIRELSKRTSDNEIAEQLVYRGDRDYISRFVGDRVVCLYGDTEMCAGKDKNFLTDIGNGLAKTATENYLTIYVFLISLRLLINRNDPSDQDMEYLLNAPSNISQTDNIREFFEKCIWESGWKLKDEIGRVRESLQRMQDKDTVEKIGRLSSAMVEQHRELANISQDVAKIKENVKELADFVKNDLSSYLAEKKARLKETEQEDEEVGVSVFSEEVCSHIDRTISRSGDELVVQEREGLAMLFGDKWKYLMTTSQTSLVSAGVLLKQCSDIKMPDFDYSGICICATAALESELKKIFFNGLMNYMIAKYKEPGKDEKNWPEILINYWKEYRNKQKKKDISFTMGSLPFLFGEVKYSDKVFIRPQQMMQSDLMKMRMTEYLTEVVHEPYRNTPFVTFYESNDSKACRTFKKDCFIGKCEKIRNAYRNKAAHIEVMSEQEATNCYQSVICKMERSDAYVYNAEITGVLLELYDKIDGEKLNRILKS